MIQGGILLLQRVGGGEAGVEGDEGVGGEGER